MGDDDDGNDVNILDNPRVESMGARVDNFACSTLCRRSVTRPLQGALFCKTSNGTLQPAIPWQL
eukprot:1160336-Pelagomonas_calceolata.AAC.12